MYRLPIFRKLSFLAVFLSCDSNSSFYAQKYTLEWLLPSMKPATVVLEEILRLLSDSQSLTVDELKKATNLSARDMGKSLDLLVTAGLIELKDDRVTIDPELREIMLTEWEW
jgi:hypothetical protein